MNTFDDTVGVEPSDPMKGASYGVIAIDQHDGETPAG
jgi:hypothetical protein